MEVIEFALLLAADMRDPLMPLWAMELTAKVLLYAWLFALGGTVGSFLNVVVYRLPRGKNLAIPGSACPCCGHPIRLSDNIPILSWLALKGRCRDCGVRISPRYLLVETLVATTFLLVLAGELFLPASAFELATRRLLTPWDGTPFWCMYGLHLLLVVTLYAAVLIAGDGFQVTPRLNGPLLAVGLVLPLIWPEVRSVPATPAVVVGWQAGLYDGLIGLLAGASTGVVIAVAAWAMLGQGIAPIPRLRFGLLGGAIGLVFGWQRALWLSPLVLVLSALSVAALRIIKPAHAKTGESTGEPTAAPEFAAARTLPDAEAISEEVHIVCPPTEPTEPS